jgi:hypothetical protein
MSGHLIPRGHVAAILVTLVFGGIRVLGAEAGAEKLPESKRLPVMAWLGPPAEQSSVERMQELADAGFTESFANYPTIESARSALDAAQAASVKLWLALPQLRSDPEATVRQLEKHPALAGYFLTDEPSADQFKELADWAARIRVVDAVHPCYINLFPSHASSEQTHTNNYREYVDRFVREVPVLAISFDNYPIVWDRLRESWYENLQLIADVARTAKRPFWAFALAVAHDDYPIPRGAHLRVQVYTDLAYGAQTIQYFTYWTPPENPAWDFHSGPIGRDGKRTVVYDRVKKVNAELKNLSPVFVGSSVEKIGHTGSRLPLGTQRYEPIWPVVELAAESGAVVSHLANGDRRYLVVVNRNFQEPMSIAVKLDPAARASLVNKDGQLHPVMANPYQVVVPPGDVAIFAWAAGGDEAIPRGGSQ